MGPVTTGEALLDSGLGGAPYEISGGNSWLSLYYGALSIPGVFRAAQLLTSVIGGLPFDAYTDHGKDQLTLIDPRPPLLEQPCPPDARVTTMASWVLDYVFDGNAVGIIATRDSLGRPTSIYAVPARWCAARRITPKNQQYSPLPIGTVEYNVLGVTYSQEDIFHVKGLCAPGALRGFGVLEAHLRGTLRTAHEQERSSQNMSRHGVPPGFLRVTTDSEAANDPKAMRSTKQQWMRDRDEGGVAMLNNAVDFQPIAWTPDNMQMVEARNLTNVQIANIMGIPPRYVGASSGDTETYSTSETEAIDLNKFSFGGVLDRFEQYLSLLFPRGTVVLADMDKLLRADTVTRFSGYHLGISDGWLLRSEVREREHLPVIEGIDQYAETDAVQLKLNKEQPVTEAALLPPRDTHPTAQQSALGTGQAPAPGQATPIQAVAQRLPVAAQRALAAAGVVGEEHTRDASRLEIKPGTSLWVYWTVGAGTARYLTHPHPWTALRDALISEGVPIGQANGLSTNIMMATPEGRAAFAAHHKGGQHG
jgi:HK97 family phage portal protein